MVKTLYVKKILSDEQMADMEGEYFDQSKFHTIINDDTDVYTTDGKLLLKFRKNVIPKILTDLALKSYRSIAKVKHNNRGASAGILDPNKLQNFAHKLYKANMFYSPSKFRTRYLKNDGSHSKSSIGNLAPSNIAGYFDVKNSRENNDNANTNTSKQSIVPCRLTTFTRKHSDLWEQSVPFLQICDQLFQELVPDRHYLQWIKTQLTPDYAISDTAFSTVTLNYSWRTALHKDAGDFEDGFGNLIVIEDHQNPNSYQGCYTGFPQYGVACNVRTSDFLAMDVHEWHCNTEFIPLRGDSDHSDSKNTLNNWHFNRLSVVCYLRDKMIKCRTNPITDRDLKKIDRKYTELYQV